MAREFARYFYKSKTWIKCRAAYISYRQSVDGGLCEICKDEVGYIVHHKTWITPKNINDPYVTLSHDNLQFVCLNCHNKIEEGVTVSYYFTDDGEIHPVLPPNN